MKAATQTTLLILILLAIITLPQASANTCTIRPAGTCQAGEEAIASTSAEGNAHAAPPASFPGFGNELCCTETINEPYYGIEPMFTIADDGGQGHVAEPDYFPQDISGSWTQCEIRNSCRSDQACLVDISDDTQGHISTCDESTLSDFQNKICCCPFGTEYDSFSGQCLPRSSAFNVDVVSGPTTAPAGTPTDYDIRFEWGPDFGINYEMFFREVGSSVEQDTIDGPISDLDGDQTFTYEANFLSDGDYQVCGRIQDQTNTSRTRTDCRDVTVQEEYITTGLTGPTTSQDGDTETYVANYTWGNYAGGINADILVTVGGITSTADSYSISGDSGAGTQPIDITFTQTGTHEICLQARHNNDPSINGESCVDVTVAPADFVDVTGLSGPQNNLSITTPYSYDADVSWSGGDVIYSFILRNTFSAAIVGSDSGTLTGFTGTNQPVSWSTQFTDAGTYILNVSADNTQVQDEETLFIEVGEEINTTTCQDIDPEYNSYACPNPPPPDTEDGRYNWTQVTELYCPGNEDAYCRTCGTGFSWNATESDCIKDTCELGDHLIYNECSAPDPLIPTLTASPASGSAPLNVSFEINITGGVDAVDYTLDFGYGEGNGQQKEG